MKKIMLSLGLMLGALTLTNCSNEIDENINTNTDGVAFELTAAIDANRVETDSYTTAWVAGDAINLHYAVAGATTYTDNGKFTIAEEDLAAGRFTGTLSDELTAETYDWFAFYPYSSYIKNPTGSSYYRLWQQNQSVKCDDMSHLTSDASGNWSNAPLYGVATVEAGEPVAITMKQLGTMLRFNIGNATSEEITVQSVKFATTSQRITGSYKVNYTGETPVVTSSGDSYTYFDVTLNVADEFIVDAGAEPGDASQIFAAVAPFTAPVGEVLTITVTTDKGVYETTKTLSAETEFKAGVVNTINVTVDIVKEIEAITVAEFLDLENGDGPYILSGTVKNVANTQYGNFDLVDATGTVYVYGLRSPEGEQQYWGPSGVKAGDCLTIYATRGDYNSSKQANPALYISHYGITVSAPTEEVAAAGGSVEATVTLPETAVEGAAVSVACEGEGATATYADGKVTVTFAKNEGAPRAAVVTVKYGLAEQSFSVSQAKSEEYAGVVTNEATITFDKTSKRTTFTTSQQVWKENGIVVTNNKASSTTNVADYSKPARFYKSSDLIVEAPGNITKLVFNCSGSGYYLTLSNGTNYTVSGSGSATVTVAFATATSNTFTISKLANQTRCSSIVVTYEESGSDEPDTTEPVQLVMSDVTCSNAGQSENSLTFTWSAVDNATGYEVYFDNASKGTVTTTSYTATGLTAGSSHVIAVKAVGDGTNYTTSEAKTCTASTKTATTTPDDGEDDGGAIEPVTMTIAANTGTLSGKEITWTSGALTIKNYQGTSSNAIRTTDTDHFRAYQGSVLTFVANQGAFTKIEVTCTSSAYATVMETSFKNAGYTTAVSGSVVTITCSGKTEVSANMSAQSRFNKVVATF